MFVVHPERLTADAVHEEDKLDGPIQAEGDQPTVAGSHCDAGCPWVGAVFAGYDFEVGYVVLYAHFCCEFVWE